MTTKECEYMIALANENNITKAAEKLYITQPALSLFLTRFEQDLGVVLFDRTKDGLIPTYAGQRCLSVARKMLMLEREFHQDLADINANKKGILKVGTSAHIGSLILPDVLNQFYKDYPNIEVEISENRSGILEELIQTNSIDVALMHLPLQNVVAKHEFIFKDRYLMTFHQENDLASKIYYKKNEKYPYIDPSESQGQKFILAFPDQRVRHISDHILARANVIPNIQLITSSVQTAMRFAARNLGVTFVPESYLSLFKYSDKLMFCYMEEKYQPYWIFSMVYPKDTVVSVPLRRFIDISKELFHYNVRKTSG